MADAHHEHAQQSVFDAGDDPVVADAVLPELAEALTPQRFAEFPRVAVMRQSLGKLAQYSARRPRVEAIEFALRLRRQLNLPGHGA